MPKISIEKPIKYLLNCTFFGLYSIGVSEKCTTQQPNAYFSEESK